MNFTAAVTKFIAATRQSGFRSALAKTGRKIAGRLCGQHPHIDPVYAHRLKLLADLSHRLNFTVRYGPFAGMTLAPETFWAGAYRAPMLLGMYEREVLEAIADRQTGRGVFIDLGAADGFYGVGVLRAGWFATSYCYEIDPGAQAVIARNAAANGVADRVIIRGEATSGFYRDIPPRAIDGAIILIDIEGGEFDLLDAATLDALRTATIIVETHPWVADGDANCCALQARAAATHRVTRFDMGPRDPGQFEELKSWSDTDRWLICSEDRPRLMTWLLLEPND
ncbi:hypothetical protein [Sphingomonas sp. 28-63-12]|uniref:hypothetical protein n=1 Tax=Sphingomonas sp. 28-63-12 TaxID=1970434 RepID=UPI000BC72288|nr:MAG: hypothetical protein B7Y47_00825 [Sphingomonas sp. 28-63-12]